VHFQILIQGWTKSDEKPLLAADALGTTESVNARIGEKRQRYDA
jgi:hypothetical protein